MKNIVLIGMPGCGKSTIGLMTADLLDMSFIDTDKVMEQMIKKNLQMIIDNEGIEKAVAIEEEAILSVHVKNFVIATGGSAIYSSKAIEHLKSNGIMIYLSVPFEILEKRVKNVETRGIVMKKGQSFNDLYNERIPLYKSYSDIIIDCLDKDKKTIANIIVEKVKFHLKRLA